MTILAVLVMSLDAQSRAGEIRAGEMIEVFALQQEDLILFRVENVTSKIVYLGEPKESGVIVRVKSDLMEGDLSSSVKMSPDPWKNTILLTERAEDQPHLWSHLFSLKADRSKVGRITEMEVIMWVATEDEHLKAVWENRKGGSIPQLRQIRMNVKVAGAGRERKSPTDPESVVKEPALKTTRVEGLPLRLGNAGLMKVPDLSKEGLLDLTDAFREMGIGISESEFVHYDSPRGLLIQKLYPNTLSKVEHVIGELYLSENRQAIARAYLFLLRNRNNDERIELVMNTGFPPDPIIAALILEIHSLESSLNEVRAFGALGLKKPSEKSKSEQEKITRLRSRLDKLLTISLKRLEEQVAVLDRSDP